MAGLTSERWKALISEAKDLGTETVQFIGGEPTVHPEFPEKPKGMHWSTYERLWWDHHEAEMEQLAGMREWLDNLEKKVG